MSETVTIISMGDCKALSLQAPPGVRQQMSSEFMARRRIYEGDDTKTFQAAVTVMARRASVERMNAISTNNVPAPTRIPTPTGIGSPVSGPNVAPGRSSESLRRKSRLSEDARPVVPKRTSSIKRSFSTQRRSGRQETFALYRQSCQLFSSLDNSVLKNRSSDATMSSELSQAMTGKSSIDFGGEPVTVSSSLSSAIESPIVVEDSPLAFTLARKATSLAPISPEEKPLLDRLRYQCRKRESQVGKRESIISIRDRASFLSSFPQPPKSPQPASNRPSTHHRSTSSRYILFPRTESQQRDKEFNSNPSSPTVPSIPTSPAMANTVGHEIAGRLSDEGLCALPPAPSVQRNPIQSPDLSVSLSIPTRRFSIKRHMKPSSTEPISRASQEARAEEGANIDHADGATRKITRRIAPRWWFGSLGGDKVKITEKPQTPVRHVIGDRKGSLRQHRLNTGFRKAPESIHTCGKENILFGTPTKNDQGVATVTSNSIHEQQGTLRQTSSGVVALREKSSSTSNLLTESEQQRETYAERWEREMGKGNQSTWKRMLCF